MAPRSSSSSSASLSPPPTGLLHLAMLVAVAAVSGAFRLMHVERDLWFFGDQLEHWRIAGLPLLQLPMHGTPRVDGGYSYGPIYYLVLWTLHHGAALVAHPLPHVGAWGLGALHVAAEVALLHALLRARVPALVALAIALTIASSPPEAALSHTLWNPNLAAALMLGALAALARALTTHRTGALLATVALATLAVHAHTPALFMAGPVAAAALGGLLGPRSWRARAGLVAAALGTSGALALPYLASARAVAAPTALDAAAAHPLAGLHLADSAAFLARGTATLLLAPLPAWAAGALLLLAMVGLCARGGWRSPWSWALGGGTALTWAGWAAYPGTRVSYWLCAEQAGLAVALGLGLLGVVPAGARRAAGAAMLALVLAALPGRLAASQASDRWPMYGPLMRAACTAAGAQPRPRAIVVADPAIEPQARALFALCGGQLGEGPPVALNPAP